MNSGEAQETNRSDLVSSPNITDWSLLRSKTHDFSCCEFGEDYVFEIVGSNSTRACMTSQGREVQTGDYIILQQGSERLRYQVEKIEYYAYPDDMWMALLVKR